MYIPWQRLSEATLDNLVDSYCTQMHGLCSDDDFDSLENRRKDILKAIKEGRLVIRWSESEESAWIINPEHLENP